MSTREHQILFNGLMVRAILDGRKRVTRRLVKPAFPASVTEVMPYAGSPEAWMPSRPGEPDLPWEEQTRLCPYGKPGDRLWVRETFNRTNPGGTEGVYYYRADGRFPPSMGGGRFYGGESWKPSIHMPRAASRILLEVTAVRVERLQDGEGETYFESPYLAEGVNRIHHGNGEYYYSAFRDEPHPKNWIDPFDAWRELWTSTGGDWDANPWVWVVEFKLLEVRA